MKLCPYPWYDGRMELTWSGGLPVLFSIYIFTFVIFWLFSFETLTNWNYYGVIVWFYLSPGACSCEMLWLLLSPPCIELLRCQRCWFWGVDDWIFLDKLTWSVWARDESFVAGKAGSLAKCVPAPSGLICELVEAPAPVFDCKFDPPMLEFLLATCFFFFCAVIYDKSERMRIRFCLSAFRSYWLFISLHCYSVIAVPVRSELIPGPPAAAVLLDFWAADSNLWLSFLLCLRFSVLRPFRNLLS